MEDAEIKGLEYQQGELAGYELKEYLLLKWGHKCAYKSKGPCNTSRSSTSFRSREAEQTE
jgi:hypothetical protein